MKAMILCAGLGTRLRPLTNRWPKPAIPLLGQPLLRYNLAVVRAAGVREVAINTHHLPELMRASAEAECERFGLPLTAVHEPEIQGTGGGVRGLRRFLEQDHFLVLNGDILFAVALAPIIEAHRTSGAAATMVLLPMPEGESYAAVEADPDLRIRRIAGRGAGVAGLSRWHFTGVHVMSPAVFDFMSPHGEEDINRGVYVRMMEAGLILRGHVADAPWSDLGTPARYLATQVDLLNGRVPVEAFPGASPFQASGVRRAGEGIVPPALVDGGARLGVGAVIGPGVYVSGGAEIGARARLTRCAVLEETLVEPGEELAEVIAWGPHRICAGAESPSSRS
jgi:mannose-1-phosphate guanylyltransferase